MSSGETCPALNVMGKREPEGTGKKKKKIELWVVREIQEPEEEIGSWHWVGLMKGEFQEHGNDPEC